MELLSIVEPYQADEIIQEISKLGDYQEQLSLYLDKVRSEEDFLMLLVTLLALNQTEPPIT